MRQNLHGAGKGYPLMSFCSGHQGNECFMLADLLERLGLIVKDVLHKFQTGKSPVMNNQLAMVCDEIYNHLGKGEVQLRAQGLYEDVNLTNTAIHQLLRGHVTPKLLIQLESISVFFLEMSFLLRSSIRSVQ